MGTALSLPDALKRAVSLHQAGRLEEAEAIYLDILNRAPRNADALNLFGVLSHERGRSEQAVGLFDQALAAAPGMAGAYYNKANVLESLGRRDEAIAAYRKTIDLRPEFAAAWLNLGSCLHGCGNVREAVSVLRDMTVRFPNELAAHYNLGRCLTEMGDKADAENAFKAALTLDAKYLDALVALANLQADSGRIKDAIATIKQAIASVPGNAEFQSVYGNWLSQIGDHDGAVQAHDAACALAPGLARYLVNKGASLMRAVRLDEAQQVFTDAAALDKDSADARLNLALVLDEKGLTSEAIRAAESALAVEPNNAAAYQALAGMLLDFGSAAAASLAQRKAKTLAPSDPMMAFSESLFRLAVGDFEEGWKNFESRFDLWLDQRYHHKGVARRSAPPPYWNGEDLSGKKIFVWSEQAVGDEILFAGLLSDLFERSGQVIVECPPRLAAVFERSFPKARVVKCDQSIAPLGDAQSTDYQIAIGSLGRYLRPNFTSFPKHPGYLRADPARISDLRERYGTGPLIGLSWRSGAERIGRRKSTKLIDWSPLLKLPSVTFVNLQYGDCQEELNEVRRQMGGKVIHDPCIDPLGDMDDYFAQIAAMDLIISTSNTTVHVAGALGKPVWMLLPQGVASHWYWFRNRDDSPWYPSLRLFRQARPSAKDTPWWTEPLERITKALPAWTNNRNLS